MYMIIEVALGKAVDKVSVAVIGLPLIGVVLQWKKTIFRSKGLHDLRWTGNKCRLMAGAFLNS